MRRQFLASGLLLLAGCGASGAEPPAGPAAAHSVPQDAVPARAAPLPVPAERGLPARQVGALVIQPGGYELGAVKPNSVHEVRVALRNAGEQPIVITKASSDCKCTVPEPLNGTVIQPGAEKSFNAVFTARAAPEHKEAKLHLVFKTGQQAAQAAVVTIGADVTMAVQAEPPYMDAQKGVTSGTVRVTSTDGRPFRIVSAGGQPPAYADGLDAQRAPPRGSYSLRWELHYPQREEECRNERLWWVIETDHPDCPVLPLRIRHECTGTRSDTTYRQRHWLFTEYMVNAGTLPAGRPIELDLDVWRIDGVASTGINAVESLSPDATAELVSIYEPQDGDISTCRVRFTPRAGVRGLLYAMVNFRSPVGDKDVAFLARVVGE